MAHAITVKVRPLTITLLVLVLLVYFFYTSDFAGQGALDHVPAPLTKPRKHPNVAHDDPFEPLAPWHNLSKQANAIIVIIGGDSEFDAVRHTMKQVETKFNSVYKYPYLFLDEEGFSTKFRKATTDLTEATTHYGAS
ncbi:hypothetical protein BC936DRAFT_142152 [Jimgerdemannia flammicorona]|uniref:Uncharacterized protein n=1 Tax=Jimgerdemannia flammicorona TaxID=994334 RepID=A0A433A0T7_9FUNG|nr:hypothetical protein BC936DRAFT_142152 [Jimgerdemannia flammicorona]